MRVLIDCSYVDFSRQPTGIPRVVLKYIETGFEWGRDRQVEVIPVVLTENGPLLCRPVPGKNAPSELKQKARTTEHGRSTPTVWEWSARTASSYVQNVVHHFIHLISALIPLPPIKSVVDWIDQSMRKTVDAFIKRSKKKVESRLKIDVGVGDIVFCPAYWHDLPVNHFLKIKDAGGTVVILVHDLLPIVSERFYDAPWKHQFADNVKSALTYADAFFCVSDFTRRSLMEFATRNKLPTPPMVTAYNGYEPLAPEELQRKIASGEFQPLLSQKKTWNYFAERQPFLMVGSIEPKKGHIPVIGCLEAMWSLGFERDLAIVGRRGWLEREVVEKIENSPYFNKKLFWFTGLDDIDLLHAYLNCKGLIFSSVAEGFGLPMIEASNLSKPSIVYDTLIAREVLGDCGFYFDNAAVFVETCLEIDANVGNKVSTKLSTWERWPSWSEYAPKVFDALLKVPGKDLESGVIGIRDVRSGMITKSDFSGDKQAQVSIA
jgi:Glycosyl transferases group 1